MDVYRVKHYRWMPESDKLPASPCLREPGNTLSLSKCTVYLSRCQAAGLVAGAIASFDQHESEALVFSLLIGIIKAEKG